MKERRNGTWTGLNREGGANARKTGRIRGIAWWFERTNGVRRSDGGMEKDDLI
jgi:hypothetical protein